MNFDLKSTPRRSSVGSIRRPGSGAKFEDRVSRFQRLSQRRSSLGTTPALSNDHSHHDISKRIKVEIEERINDYEFNVNFYSIPPFGRVHLQEAEEFIKERLNILRAFSDMRAGPTVVRQNTAYFSQLNDRVKSTNDGKNFLVESIGGRDNVKVQAARRRDHVSHFLLRLFCCRNEELRKWFIQHETEMLRFRLLDESSNVNLSEFLDYNNLIYERASEEYRTHLIKSNIINPPTMRKSNFELYCIPFEEALDLIRNRRVYVENGLCYVMPREMVYIICTRFRMELAQSLANLSNYLPQLEEENRLLPLFEAIYNEKIKNNRPTQNIENRNGLEQVTPDMVDQLALDHFPPCMRNMHDSLRAAHHLRHFGRLHYGLFLKSIGMRMEDALQFFREEFIQKVTPERFQREYAYNIRYNYGKEGKRVNMSAYSCAKILNENGPGPGDSHGCPFKHFDEANLVRMLRSHRIKEEAITEMVEMASQKNYTGSCSRYFSCKQPNYPLNEKGIFHPSQFYVESRKAARGIPSMVSEKEDDDETAKTNNGEELDEFDDDLDDQMFSELTEQDVGLMMQKNEDSGDSNPANLDQSSKEDSNQSVKKLKVDLLKMQQTEDVKNEESSETVDKSDSTLNLSKIKSTTTGESIGPEQENKKLPGVAEATIDVKNQSDGLTSASIFEQMDKKPIVDQVVKNTQFDHSETSTSIPMEE